MHFDWTINVGSLLTFAAMGFAIWEAYRQHTKNAQKQYEQNQSNTQEQHAQNQRRLEHIETRLDMIYDWFIKKVVNRIDA